MPTILSQLIFGLFILKSFNLTKVFKIYIFFFYFFHYFYTFTCIMRGHKVLTCYFMGLFPLYHYLIPMKFIRDVREEAKHFSPNVEKFCQCYYFKKYPSPFICDSICIKYMVVMGTEIC